MVHPFVRITGTLQNVDSIYIPQSDFNEFWIILYGTLSKLSRGFLLATHVTSIEFWIFFILRSSLCIFDVSDYYPKLMEVPSWYLIWYYKNKETSAKFQWYGRRDVRLGKPVTLSEELRSAPKNFQLNVLVDYLVYVWLKGPI